MAKPENDLNARQRPQKMSTFPVSPRVVQASPIYTGMVWVTRQLVHWQHDVETSNGDGADANTKSG